MRHGNVPQPIGTLACLTFFLLLTKEDFFIPLNNYSSWSVLLVKTKALYTLTSFTHKLGWSLPVDLSEKWPSEIRNRHIHSWDWRIAKQISDWNLFSHLASNLFYCDVPRLMITVSWSFLLRQTVTLLRAWPSGPHSHGMSWQYKQINIRKRSKMAFGFVAWVWTLLEWMKKCKSNTCVFKHSSCSAFLSSKPQLKFNISRIFTICRSHAGVKNLENLSKPKCSKTYCC